MVRPGGVERGHHPQVGEGGGRRLEVGEASGTQALTGFISLLCVVAAVVQMFVTYARLCWFYRCPTCGKLDSKSKREPLDAGNP